MTRLFCWHQDFVHKGLSAPALGLCTCGKTLKNQNSKRFVWNRQQMVKVIRAFCWHQKFVPKGFSALARGYIQCIKSLKMWIKSDFEEIILELATYGQREKAFLLSKNLCPQWLVYPCLGLYTCEKKHIKNGKKADFKEIFFKLAINGHSDKEFLLTLKCCSQGVVCPCPEAKYMYKII